MSKNSAQARLRPFFEKYGWTPFPFQEAAWAAFGRGQSGLVHAPTGMGKTLSVWLGPVAQWMEAHPDVRPEGEAAPLQVLWITPLRALANDTVESLRFPIRELGLPWTVEKRTGDTSSTQKQKQKERFPSALVTTPESLSLLLSYASTQGRLGSLRAVIVDEWHELLGTKRGVQTELCLARLREWCPGLRVWGLSATLGNLEEAREVLLGGRPGALITGAEQKVLRVETMLPETVESFPWAGHLGIRLLPDVVAAIEAAGTTLLFTNTRSQAEMWYESLQQQRPQWEGEMALHHGSLDLGVRKEVEEGLRTGTLRCVVATSSLDLGVDFSPVDQVIQLGSPKGIARLLQRAGRAGHRPGAVSKVLCVPTNALELVEFSAARQAAERRAVEAREPLRKPLDLLVQHLITVAAGGGFVPEAMRREVESTFAFRDLTDGEWQWCLDFIGRGGPALRAYPQFQRVAERDGVWKMTTENLAKMHRLTIGTIVSDTAVRVRFKGGGTLGQVEESFASKLKPGDVFLFGGRSLEVVRMKDMTLEVRTSKGSGRTVPRWMGGRMPLSTLLADAIRARIDEARTGVFADDEMERARPLLEIQAALSRLPAPEELLVEIGRSRDGHHAFVYPFAGRLVHEGLAALAAFRIGRIQKATFSTSANDYGFELASRKAITLTEQQWAEVLSPAQLLEDLLACVNDTEMARRQFRSVARVAGLIFQGYPGQGKTSRQLQTSAGLLFDVFRQFDPENLLLEQARREVLEGQLEFSRLGKALEQIARQRLILVPLKRLSPFSFPLWADRIREHVSTEAWIDRVQGMLEELEAEAGKAVGGNVEA